MMNIKCFSLFFALIIYFLLAWYFRLIYCRCGIFYHCFYTFGALCVNLICYGVFHIVSWQFCLKSERLKIQRYRRGKRYSEEKNCGQSYSTIPIILLVPAPTASLIDSYIVWKDLGNNDRNLEYFGRLTTWNC